MIKNRQPTRKAPTPGHIKVSGLLFLNFAGSGFPVSPSLSTKNQKRTFFLPGSEILSYNLDLNWVNVNTIPNM